MHQQSGKVTLESKEKLPSKLYDVVCDANLLVSHIQAASGSNEMLGTATKQFVAQENTIECTAQAIDRLNKLVDDLDDALPFPSEITADISAVQETLQSIEAAEFLSTS